MLSLFRGKSKGNTAYDFSYISCLITSVYEAQGLMVNVNPANLVAG